MASYTGRPSVFGIAAPLGLLFNKVTVIQSRVAHSPKQLALSQEVPPNVKSINLPAHAVLCIPAAHGAH